MCFRPPEAGAGESVCPGCYIVIAPNPDGTCPECGAKMREPIAAAGAPAAPAAPGAPVAPVPKAPEA